MYVRRLLTIYQSKYVWDIVKPRPFTLFCRLICHWSTGFPNFQPIIMITQPGIALMLLVKCPYGDSQEGHQVNGRRCQNLAEHLSFYMKWMVQSWNSVKGSSQSQISRFWTVLQVPRPLQWLSSLHSNTIKMDKMYRIVTSSNAPYQ